MGDEAEGFSLVLLNQMEKRQKIVSFGLPPISDSDVLIVKNF